MGQNGSKWHVFGQKHGHFDGFGPTLSIVHIVVHDRSNLMYDMHCDDDADHMLTMLIIC
jgi:hypothetical protein